jgi:hypothetical protein
MGVASVSLVGFTRPLTRLASARLDIAFMPSRLLLSNGSQDDVTEV